MNEVAQVAYLLTAILFIFGIMRLRSPDTARSGNAIAAVGMIIAIAVTVLDHHTLNLAIMAAAMVAGTGAGAVAGRRVRMTAMPQMVALFNGMGGGAAALVATADLARQLPAAGILGVGTAIAAMLSVIIGSISFSGSALAFAKLQELMTGRPVAFPGQNMVNAVVLAVVLLIATSFVVLHATPVALVAVLVGSLALGVLAVLPVGGADMPVIISSLNSLTGLAAAANGFVIGNNALIIGGALVGASGTILTVLMSKAMNRSITNVLFGAFGGEHTAVTAVAAAQQMVRSTSAEDVAALLAYANRVIIVPGYGLAVARAQQEVRELTELLEKRHVDVEFAIHPVAGRMPGHMNVLLAEADIPYPRLHEMDEINPEFSSTDAALVVGANDVTNPAARSDSSSPIYGMPILNVDQARTIIVLKRSMNPGFAGIDNPLYYNPKTLMLFGDAHDSLAKLVGALKEM
jgi:NAD(P) transhydrogenase subunit beta